MKVERYVAYKDSEVEWLGEIPKHWALSRVKEIAYINQKSLSDGTPLDYEFYYVDIGSVTYGTSGYLSERMTFKNAPSRAKRIVKSGDTIISTVRTYLKAITQIENAENLIVSTGFAVLTPKRMIFRSYFSNWLMSETFINRVSAISKGVSYPATNSTEIGDLFVLLPPHHEQTAIAAYLDTKASQIDRKIELLNQKATYYGNLKQSLINETVTRGLDKSVPMKATGVEWIGEVPEHWQVQRIGTAFEERSEKVNDTDYPPLSVSMSGIVPQMESVAKTDNNENRKRVAIGDYVINSRSDRRGASGVSIFDGSVSVINIVLKPRRHFFGKYLHHLFRSYRFIEEFYRVGRGIVDDLWTTRYSVMKGIEFSYPSYEEQKMIADYLDKKTAQIDRIVVTINAQIDKLKELRKVLINDVVTGKIKVTNVESEV